MFRRKIYDKLLEWKKESDGRTALMLEGARRVGKSYIVEEFAKKEFITKYSEQLHIPYVLHPGDLMEKDEITYLQLYMTSFL